MVVICSPTYSGQRPPDTMWAHPLDHFQKHALDALDRGHSTLVTAHTGAGKTVVAEYAIARMASLGRRTIYTSPVKSLSNQKFHELSRKFPDITFGILTGDIKANPDAQCLIMTTEILRNTLLARHTGESRIAPPFSLDDGTPLGSIIYDEVHYINDPDRGTVWEEAIMLTPPDCQLAMLSATLDDPAALADWIESVTGRTVCVSGTIQRPVPLSHHLMLHYPAAALESQLAGRATRKVVETIQDMGTSFAGVDCDSVLSTCRALSRAASKHQKAPDWHLSAAITELKARDQLPAITFVFSRARVESLACGLRGTFADDPMAAASAFSTAIKGLPNWREHTAGAEYTRLEGLVRRGIAYHHSGVTPVLKEAVECVFALGHIKVLVATETFAIGVNMPARAVLFTDVAKRIGATARMLFTHEYTQMAGRAGRRGLDSTGNVYILPALCRELPSRHELQQLTSGRAPAVASRFKLHLGLILRFAKAGGDAASFANDTLMARAIANDVATDETREQELHAQFAELGPPTAGEDDLCNLADAAQYGSQKARRKSKTALARELEARPQAAARRQQRIDLEDELATLQTRLASTRSYLEETVRMGRTALSEMGYLRDDATLTDMGTAATLIQETNSLAVADVLCSGALDTLDAPLLAAFLSGFYPIRVRDDSRPPPTPGIEDATERITQALGRVEDANTRWMFDVAEDSSYHTGLSAAIIAWCAADTPATCEGVLLGLETYGVFRGELVKAVLKINASASELAAAAIVVNKPGLACVLDEVRDLTLKHIATSQSLYLELDRDSTGQ
jgi:superfamily II RNA helicase